ncbi:hypothetical protein [Roseateles depolymerans]|uniref:Uncharacterized protein n=1 Tax=Roseateles depolymerans TaxID=76731 RepID=A0A0U3L0Y4_9BURK|nr:hypothetical protein [Roseateles depolymerans]ALV04990.1 hypothetical protein RD2015_489 [Roseateles depolymerans]REG14998.1 hypothetical protein DES44_3503 [Roseateles depolymerans]
MKANEITALVVENASRFGDRNPQQVKYLTSRFRDVEETAVAHGLLRVFTEGAGPPEGSAAQELAGQLLEALCPKSSLELSEILSAALSRYELSVEQFPLYLALTFGKWQMLAELDRLENAMQLEAEYRAIQTMKFWLRG